MLCGLYYLVHLALSTMPRDLPPLDKLKLHMKGSGDDTSYRVSFSHKRSKGQCRQERRHAKAIADAKAEAEAEAGASPKTYAQVTGGAGGAGSPEESNDVSPSSCPIDRELYEHICNLLGVEQLPEGDPEHVDFCAIIAKQEEYLGREALTRNYNTWQQMEFFELVEQIETGTLTSSDVFAICTYMNTIFQKPHWKVGELTFNSDTLMIRAEMIKKEREAKEFATYVVNYFGFKRPGDWEVTNPDD